MTNSVGRPPGQGKVVGSGRKRGSLDKQARTLISERLAFDVIATYKKLGPNWLLELAKTRPDLFVNQLLARLLPAPQKSDDEPNGSTYNTQFNIGNMGEMEAARRVAFALAKAVYPDPAVEHEPLEQPVAERMPMTPQEACRVPEDMPPPEPAEDPDRERWASELPLSSQERADRAVVRETVECDITNYRGAPGEQPGSGPVQHHKSADRDPRAAQMGRLLAARRKKLL